MKPIKLEIEGLNSFSEKQIIDFSLVLKEGIFGIFGNTGSGKSTILDAIVLALYGRTQKNNKKQEFVNCNSKKAVVSFSFEILFDGVRKVFEFYREFYPTERNGVATVYAYEGDKKFMLAEKAERANALAEEIIGLEFEDFKKCIALPQGEFDRFTKSKKSERLDIIARLFSLEKYGQKLYDRASAVFYEYDKQCVAVEGELRSYEEYTEEVYKSYESNIQKDKGELLNAQNKLDDYNKSFVELEEIRLLHSEIVGLEEKFTLESKKAESNAEKKIALEKTDSAEKLVAYYDETKLCETELDNMKKEFDKVERTLSSLETERKKLLNDGFEKTYDEEKSKLISKKAELDSLKDFYVEKQTLEKQIDEKLDSYKRLAADNKRLDSALVGCTEKLDMNLESQTRLGDNSEDFIESVCKNAVRSEYVYLKDKNDENGKVLWLSDIIDEKLSRNESTVKEFSIEDEKEKAQRRKNLKEAEAAINKEIAELKTLTAVNGEKLEKLKTDGSELRQRLNKINERIDCVTGGKDFAEIYKKTNLSIKELEDKKCEREKIQTENTEKIKDFSALKSSLAVKIENLIKKITENTEKIKEISSVCGIIDVDSARKSVLTEEQKRSYAADVQKSSDSFAIINAALEEKRKRLSGRTFDSVKYSETAESIKACAERIEVLKRAIAVNENALKLCEEKLAKKKSICEVYSVASEKKDTAKRLQTLFKGRAFLEYVAEEYLVEITYVASATLMKLTSGRYSLKYNQEFFVCDNVNGGAERSVNTLSGGETFLVSLSLAFALSSAICAKSDRPIEFFFLDEGFGTLDDELIEVVIASLEKFKNAHFSIGIISHVKELKERINCKINVIGATDECGSKITVTY